VLAVLLACASAVLFGALAVSVRVALRRSPDPELGALASAVVALLVCAAFGAQRLADAHGGELADFFLIGMIAPGLTQIMFFRAVRDAGPARTTVLVGTAPLAAAVIAIAWLDEPVRLALVVATLLIVGGGILLAREPIRPEHFRAVGAALALGAAVLFATRDNLIRRLSENAGAASLAAAAATLAGGIVVMAAYLLATRRRRGAKLSNSLLQAWAPWLPAGLLFGLSYAALFEAYYRGRVTVVSPLVATESLWGVLFAAVVLGRSELIGRHLLLGAALIVAGGVLIGATR
jgi:S-adenosylmethionine uptake transporter